MVIVLGRRRAGLVPLVLRRVRPGSGPRAGLRPWRTGAGAGLVVLGFGAAVRAALRFGSRAGAGFVTLHRSGSRLGLGVPFPAGHSGS